ncbi:MAG: PIN domain-containing protein [Pontimonas sp.]
MFSAVLDTSVIFPARLNDTLLSFAEQDLYRPLWSEEILNELRVALSRTYPHRNPRSVEARVMAMCRAFPAATVAGWEKVAEEIASSLPDAQDAHVIAAGRIGGAQVIVTNNLKDFPSNALSEWGMRPLSADQVLMELWRSNTSIALSALHIQSTRLRKPPLSPEEILDQLTASVPGFSRLARQSLHA